MGEKRQTFHVEEFQIICIDAVPSGRCGLRMVTSFQGGQYGKEGGKSNFMVETWETLPQTKMSNSDGTAK